MKNLFDLALAAEGVTGDLASLARSIYQQESGSGKNTKTSNANATGGMQIIPSTFNSVADKGWDINDPMHNARAGIRYISQLSKKSGGDHALTAAGYYGGPGAMEKARKGIAVSDPRNPTAPNTLQYGQQVVARMGKGSAPAMDVSPLTSVPQVAHPTTQVSGIPVDAVNMAQARSVPDTVEQYVPVNTNMDWSQFQQRTAPPVQVADLQFGAMPQMKIPDYPVSAPAVKAPKVNFNPFTAWKARA